MIHEPYLKGCGFYIQKALMEIEDIDTATNRPTPDANRVAVNDAEGHLVLGSDFALVVKSGHFQYRNSRGLPAESPPKSNPETRTTILDPVSAAKVTLGLISLRDVVIVAGMQERERAEQELRSQGLTTKKQAELLEVARFTDFEQQRTSLEEQSRAIGEAVLSIMPKERVAEDAVLAELSQSMRTV